MDERGVLSALTKPIEAEVAAADGDTCGDLLRLAESVRGRVDAIEAQITSRLRQLHDQAGGAPAADQHTRCGGVSSTEGKRKERRPEAPIRTRRRAAA